MAAKTLERSGEKLADSAEKLEVSSEHIEDSADRRTQLAPTARYLRLNVRMRLGSGPGW
jgi:hypothetical protein